MNNALNESQELAGLRALVTGGASGIGLATVRVLEQRGASVAILDIAEQGPEASIFAHADVSSDESVRRAVGEVLAKLGGLDILVNCAGIGAQGDVSTNSDQEWHEVFDINVVGVARVTRACLDALRTSSRAAIVNVSSIAATVGLPDRVLYSATKGAVLAMTMAMAADLLPDGVRVNAVNPGTTDTPWISRLLDRATDPDAERAALAARQPHGRLVSSDEVAWAIAYLASPSSGSTTGTYLAVDGGMQRLRTRPTPSA
ncbi:MAG: SDR family oxidoreductase [Actinomycetota bacterium]|jgi:short-subunit dehydrogenase